MIGRKVSRKGGGSSLHPSGSNVEQNHHPSKHQGKHFGKTFGVHKKAYNKNSSYPRAASAVR